MPPESWLVVTVAAAFLLLGVAASPLAWLALLQRRSRSEARMEERFRELAGQLHALRGRLGRCEVACRIHAGHGPPKPVAAREWPVWAPTPADGSGQGPALIASVADPDDDPPLIAVPNLASASQDRQATHGALARRYAAIWTLADNGASPEVIARATGQPIGQIELILGLRRQLDGARTPLPTPGPGASS